eukprot:TRINITY_DN778169_c0_g1_i1.p1 TRINITY_DN778169_c0_g1~~TRINITY_DN778169_c0_g1_i1.p1  ORF type:complete len:251 (+),score=54.20 TRINITY_DN778169_c0_g1_i1:65-817(+)
MLNKRLLLRKPQRKPRNANLKERPAWVDIIDEESTKPFQAAVEPKPVSKKAPIRKRLSSNRQASRSKLPTQTFEVVPHRKSSHDVSKIKKDKAVDETQPKVSTAKDKQRISTLESKVLSLEKQLNELSFEPSDSIRIQFLEAQNKKLRNQLDICENHLESYERFMVDVENASSDLMTRLQDASESSKATGVEHPIDKQDGIAWLFCIPLRLFNFVSRMPMVLKATQKRVAEHRKELERRDDEYADGGFRC